MKSRKAVKVGQDKFNEIHDYTWSPDGRWLAWSKQRDNQHARHLAVQPG